ncbi:MAG: MlaD family protein [Methyloversatilis sp.]|jgi:phospholipid/cholesterol/gamma-HCH transport system substrate-binding protein|nr:MlaD family protein [Methyloversatilis sp.]
MESRAHALAAGLFLLLLSLAVGLAIWYLSSGEDAGQEYLLVTTADVGGLSPQAQVRYRGIRVGKVREISISPENPREIHVRVSIPARYPVTAGTRAELGYLGVTGLALIDMTDDGSDPTPLSPADARIPLRGSQFGGLGNKASDTMEVMRQVLLRLQVLLDERNLERIGATLNNLQSATAQLDRTMVQLPGVAGDLRETLQRTQLLLSADNLDRTGRILTRLEAVAGQGEPLAQELRALLASMQQLSSRLDALAASTGQQINGDMLPRLQTLLDEASRDARQLRRVLGELESSPQVLLLGRDLQRPGPGEPGFDPAAGGARE